ncbi:phosphoribosylamine--glycine ligase [Woeseia oceani]|uniref:Phosphoribosylamine--glycine ligase n=1 Tax=Woeseia oceani TaxID=1548547 RepID=A0A193LIS5_9GAMM|nr:phosphoribosylamine--glycine ligase [Woeseia oceani]ANO52294.1 phosphoribosylamine--glycine ligase [Woeseia oceani]
MKVLIVGGGGREHAMAWKCAQSPAVSEVIVAPGNAGTAREPGVRNAAVAADDIDALLELASSENIGLTIVGPEVPLVAGIVDRFGDNGLPCFGPNAKASQLEGSKSFTKDFLARHAIPTAAYASFSEIEPALEWLRARGAPIVIKADGLAAGKGVVVAQTLAEAEQAVHDMLGDRRYGGAGASIVIEEFLAGEEASFIVMCDGISVLPLATSQDHKARDDGDLGPNTGGMGAYSPAPVVTADLEQRIMREIIEPTLAGLKKDGIDYLGFLYAGLMIDSEGTPRVLEFNCRFGDPETQPILSRLKSDLVELCIAALDGKLGEQDIEWDPRAALGVVMAAGGYPESYEKGRPIKGLSAADDNTSKVFHAGTALDNNTVVTSGGRVLCVVGLGNSVAEARDTAYARVDRISFDDAFCRRDIGYRAIAREAQ